MLLFLGMVKFSAHLFVLILKCKVSGTTLPMLYRSDQWKILANSQLSLQLTVVAGPPEDGHEGNGEGCAMPSLSSSLSILLISDN